VDVQIGDAIVGGLPVLAVIVANEDAAVFDALPSFFNYIPSD
jgi:hypothetical protein